MHEKLELTYVTGKLPLYHYKLLLFMFYYTLCVHINIDTAFLHFAWCILIFFSNLFVSLHLKCIYCQKAYG